MSTVDELARPEVVDAVRRIVVAESRLSVDPARIAEDEPLNGDLLRINSLGFLGMIVRLEDDLAIELSDDVFVGRVFTTVADLVDAVLAGGAR